MKPEIAFWYIYISAALHSADQNVCAELGSNVHDEHVTQF